MKANSHTQSPSTVLTIEVLGRRFTGHYSVRGIPAVLHVTSAWGEKSTPLGDFPEEPLARQLLREIAAEAPPE